MATWEDGPEYAPAVRPDEYTGPADAVALDAPKPPDVDDAPPISPQGYETPPQPDLASYTCNRADRRDPAHPFLVQGAPLSRSGHQFGKVGEVDPYQPISLSTHTLAPVRETDFAAPLPPAASSAPYFPPPAPGAAPVAPYSAAPNYPAPGTPGWFAPAQTPPVPAPATLTFTEWMRAMTPGLVISATLGLILNVMAIYAFIIAWLFSLLSPHRRQLRTIFVGVSTPVVALALVSFAGGWYFDVRDWWEGVGTFFQLANGLVLIVAGWWVGLRISRDNRRRQGS